MLLEEQIQRELIRLLNKWGYRQDTTLLEVFANWTEEHLISPYKIVKVDKHKWKLENKLTGVEKP